jgi:hypothetical protein
MEPEIFRNEFLNIIEGTSALKKLYRPDDILVRMNEEQLFHLWNTLGEELGIDLSILSSSKRSMLLNYCQKNMFFSTKEFTALIWLVYYSDLRH